MQRFADQASDFQRRGQFKQAIAFYDRAIVKASSAQLLDGRAECLSMLGDYEAALKDAKASIQHASTDPIGYLRAGKVLQKMGKDEVAMQVMGTGLRRVKHAGKAFEDLRKEHKSLTNKLSPDKSVDPLTMLPRELAIMVLNYLDFHRMVGAMRVSRGWSRFIASCPELWHHLNFITVPARRTKVRTAAVRKYVNIARRNATRLSINNMFDFDVCFELILQQCSIDDIMLGPDVPRLNGTFARTVVKYCSRLRRLNFSSCMSLNSGLVTFTILSTCVETAEELDIRLAHAMPSLAPLEFPKLRSLSISPSSHSAIGSSLMALPKMPKIESLVLRGPLEGQPHMWNQFKTCEKLSHLSIMSTIDGPLMIELPPSIRSFELVARYNRAGSPGPVLQPFDLPLLEALHVEQWHHTVDRFLDMFLKGSSAAQNGLDQDEVTDTTSGSGSVALKPLTQLKLFNCDFEYGMSTGLKPLLVHDRLKSMETLMIYQVSGWDDEHMEIVAKHMPNLRYLRIANASVTGVGVKAVFEGCPHLKSFEVSSCKLAPDAVAWARSKGVKVNNRMDKV